MKNNKIISKVIASSLVFAIGAISSAPVLAYTKDETVYTKLNSEGNSYKTIVSEHLKNTDGLELLKDMSELLNIENMNGDENPTQNGTTLQWKAAGNDIYYQGNIQKELPIDCTIKYELDGEEISSKDLAGKSGKVKIIIEYTNKESRILNINGKAETMYVPFVIMTGTVFDNTKIKNIEVTNGKVTDNGQNSLVVALACPGLVESLGLADEKDMPNLNKIEITFDAEKFEMGNIMSYATPKIFEESDISNMDKLNEVYNQINQLKSASTQLVEGANSLKEGTITYVEKSSEFSNAMDSFTNGMNTASNSYTQIDNGIESVNSNIGTLKNGASQVNAGVDQVNSGLNTLKDGVAAGKKQASTALSQSATELSNGIDQIIAGKDTETGTIKEKVIDGANSQLSAGLKTGVTSAVTTGIEETMSAKLQALVKAGTITAEQAQVLGESLSLTKEEQAQLGSTINSVIDSAIDKTSEAQKIGLDQINNADTGVKSGLKQLKTQASKGFSEGISQIENGFDVISNGTDELISGTNALKSGTSKLEAGTNVLETGVSTLAKGSKQLKQGISTLNSSSTMLNNANNQLLEGANSISEGATTLSEGITQFDEEGVNKIVSYINGNLKDMQLRIEKLLDLANEYNNFAGLEEGTEGNTKFILEIDSIKNKGEEQTSNLPVNNTANLEKSQDNNEETSSGK